MLIIIFISNSKHCEIAFLYAFLIAEKYPLMLEDSAIKGRTKAIK